LTSGHTALPETGPTKAEIPDLVPIFINRFVPPHFPST
jgi:hypothetical protein